MNCRETNFFRVIMRVVLGFDVRKQRELREKFLNATELKCELGQLLQLVRAALIVVVSLDQIIVIASVQNQPQHFRRAFADSFVLELRNRRGELRPRDRRLR